MVSTTPEKKRRRLGGLFDSNKNKAPKQEPKQEPSSAPKPPDSGYGSSTNGSRTSSSNNANVVPVENRGQIAGVSADRNLAVNNSTGQVLDDDTGEVVTTTTTTTTTTITRVRSPNPESVRTKSSNAGAQGASAQVSQPQQQQQHLTVPSEGARFLSTNPGFQQTSSHSSNIGTAGANSSNTAGPNVSQPGRPNVQGGAHEWPGAGGEQPSAPTSAFGNLKAAAIGLQGVGETLRGTISSEVDARYPRRNPKKVSAAELKNQATPQDGQSIFRPKTPRKTPPRESAASPHAPPDPMYHPPPSQEPMPNATPADAMSQMPASFSPESNGKVGDGKNVRPMRKLLKRKSVGVL